MSEDETGGDEPTQEGPEEGDAAEQPPAEQPTVDWDSDDNPYKQRFNDLRPVYDRTQNLVAQLENPETQAEVLRRFGIELEDADDDPIDTDEPMTRAEFQAWQQQLEQSHAAQTAADQALDFDATAIETDLAVIEKEHGKLTDEELDILLPLATNNRRQDGSPGFKEAFEQVSGLVKTRHKAYLGTKIVRGQPGIGTAGTDKVNLSDDDERQQAMQEIMEAEAAAEA